MYNLKYINNDRFQLNISVPICRCYANYQLGTLFVICTNINMNKLKIFIKAKNVLLYIIPDQ